MSNKLGACNKVVCISGCSSSPKSGTLDVIIRVTSVTVKDGLIISCREGDTDSLLISIQFISLMWHLFCNNYCSSAPKSCFL